MNGRLAGALAGVIALAAAIAAIYLWRGDSGDRSTSTLPTEEIEVSAAGEANQRVAVLYFPDDHETLAEEEWPLAPSASPEEAVRVLIEALLAGPSAPNLNQPFPPGTALGVTYLAPSGLLYVDLISSEHVRPPSTGSLEEMLSVYSLVNTVLLNTSGIEAVVILWNGQQQQTFAGHLDTSLPLRADRDLIRLGR